MERPPSKPAARERAGLLPECTASRNRELRSSNASVAQPFSWPGRDAVCGGGIARIALTFAFCELSLTSNAALQSRANFLASRLLDRIGAAGEERREKECDEEKRPGLHPLILGNKH